MACKVAYCFYDRHCSKHRMVYPVTSKGLFWNCVCVGILQTDGVAELVGEKVHEILD